MTELKTGGAQGYLRIATEEAFVTQEALDMYAEILDGPDPDPGFNSLWGFYLRSMAERPLFIREALLDLGARRLKDMDDRGIDKAVLALTSPGTQVLSKDKAVALARNSNDVLAQACKDHPDRFVGMAACAPQDHEGGHHQQPHPGSLSRRAAILADPRGRRSARRADLHPPQHAPAWPGRAAD